MNHVDFVLCFFAAALSLRLRFRKLPGDGPGGIAVSASGMDVAQERSATGPGVVRTKIPHREPPEGVLKIDAGGILGSLESRPTGQRG
jgi:hypothetical protein